MLPSQHTLLLGGYAGPAEAVSSIHLKSLHLHAVVTILVCVSYLRYVTDFFRLNFIDPVGLAPSVKFKRPLIAALHVFLYL